MSETHEELLNVYDAHGRIVGALPRREAKASGQPVGAVNVLVRNPAGRVLLQKRRADKENGGRWDKTVGGHVSAGESFETAALREANEELFSGSTSPRARLLESIDALAQALPGLRGEDSLLIAPAGVKLDLRDVRLRPDGSRLNVRYHVGVFLGICALEVEQLCAQADELDGLRYFEPTEIDELLVAGQLAPNMGFLWLAHAHALLALSLRRG